MKRGTTCKHCGRTVRFIDEAWIHDWSYSRRCSFASDNTTEAEVEDER